MKYFNVVKYVIIAAALLVGSYFGVKYTWDKAYEEGREYAENAVWAYCYSVGGILTNPNVPGAAIGCMAIEGVVGEQQKKDWPSDLS